MTFLKHVENQSSFVNTAFKSLIRDVLAVMYCLKARVQFSFQLQLLREKERFVLCLKPKHYSLRARSLTLPLAAGLREADELTS